eukprot:Skav224770  [mRNA]  locus=scaffold1604:637006:638454:- [translate_table: standard]
MRRPGAAIPLAAPAPRIRRPAAAHPPGDPWEDGSEVRLGDLKVEQVPVGSYLVATEADYCGEKTKIAGQIMKVELEASGTWLAMRLTGSTSEGILKIHTAQPRNNFRVHLCPVDCTQIESGEQLVHALKGRKKKAVGEEDWVTSLEAVSPAVALGEEDQLASLRARAAGLAPRLDAAEVARERGPGRPEDKKEEASSEGKSKKKKRKKKEKKSKGKEDEDDASLVNGRHPVRASKKSLATLFAGTAMDPSQKTRKRVLRKAQKFAERKSSKRKKSKSSGDSGSSTSESSGERDALEGVFTEAKKARSIAERYPGALAWETLSAMRRSLLHTTGEEETEAMVRPTALLYYRYQLANRVSGPQSREMVNLATAIDHLLRGQPAQCLDVLCQRLKAQEAGVQGVHWAIGQQLEIPEPGSSSLAARPEIEAAQRESYADSKTQWYSQKGGGKKGEGRGKGKGGKSEKGDNQKGDRKKGDGKTAEKK